MKTIVINGSPKGKQGNTEIFIRHFISGMTHDVEVKRIVEEDLLELAVLVKEYDSIIFALPLYIHSMPGIVMRFIELLEVSSPKRLQRLGFIVQCGFPEGAQCKYLERYFGSLSKELNMQYLGTLIKAGSASLSTTPPSKTKQLFATLKKFGEIFEATHKFDMSILHKMKQPYEVTGILLKIMKLVEKTGLMDMMWNKPLRENGAFGERYARPYKP